ncbi:sterol desaturase family protein [Dyella caseinilytica]|uniref:Sterol desaturase family protein n=1 Tax=Dyella caseinilytica TaxID=1849581 RepID=A0ABX7GPT4_9GAMM|nr:sterol desaturase family protein [Dyella caseinilytica]QRN52260.1 sterol desaturase family protein [Dyella caseinilytica]GGA14424.1 sterol desaturase [Dyella caseinilytica]
MSHIFQHAHSVHIPGFLPLAMITVVVEMLWRLLVVSKGYNFRSAGSTLLIALGHTLTDALTALALAPVFALVWHFAPWHFSMHDWRVWVIGFFVVEFAYYWYHRFSHEVRWLWASHAVHHTPEEMTLLSAIRLGWTNLISAGWLVYLPVMALGFDPRMVIILLALDLRFQFFLHTEARINLGLLEWILNTPTHHRIHHASNAPYIDKNYGGALIIFDRMFGTFAAERKDEPLRYGLDHPLGTHNPLGLVFGEWRRLLTDLRRAPNWYAAARIALGRP